MLVYKKDQTDSPLVFLLISSADHISPITGRTPTVLLSKNGDAFAAPAGVPIEIGHGWYSLTIDADDFDTIGPLLLSVTASGADPGSYEFQVTSGLVDLGPTQLVDIVGNIQGSVGSVVAPVTCKTKTRGCC